MSYFTKWGATAGSACQRNVKGQPKRGPSGFPWHPAFSSLWQAACGEAALPWKIVINKTD